MSLYYNRLFQYSKAILYAKTAIDIATQIGNVESIKNAAEQYSFAASKLGNYREAYEGFFLFKQMSDSIQNDANQQKSL